MSAGTFMLSYPARTQLSLLTKAEISALASLFEGNPLERPGVTRQTGDGRFVSRIGRKRVLWRWIENGRAEVLSIIDRSYSPQAG